MTLVGGLRARLLQDSFIAVITHALDLLGWFDANRAHKPVTVRTDTPDWDRDIDYNILVFTARELVTDYAELGSNLSTDTISVLGDLYAENDALGVHLANDIRDILRGRLLAGTLRGQFPINDYRLATPVPVGYATIVDVSSIRSISTVPEAWARHVYNIDCRVEDTYYAEVTE